MAPLIGGDIASQRIVRDDHARHGNGLRRLGHGGPSWRRLALSKQRGSATFVVKRCRRHWRPWQRRGRRLGLVIGVGRRAQWLHDRVHDAELNKALSKEAERKRPRRPAKRPRAFFVFGAAPVRRFRRARGTKHAREGWASFAASVFRSLEIVCHAVVITQFSRLIFS